MSLASRLQKNERSRQKMSEDLKTAFIACFWIAVGMSLEKIGEAFIQIVEYMPQTLTCGEWITF